MYNKLLKKGSAIFALAMFFAMTHSMNAQYCVPEGTTETRHINSFSTTNGSENISNLESGFSADGYGDFFDTHAVVQIQGESIDFSADISGGSAGFRVWVDWNQDGEFDESEEVAYQSDSYGTSHSGSFSIPDDATPGETRMRIVSHWLSTSGNIDPCETGFSYGEFEDYKFEVITPEECEGTPEGGITVVNPSTGNAESTYIVSAEGYTVATGMLFQWQSDTNNEGWEDEGSATDTYEAITATAPSELGVEVEWRLALTCIESEETEHSEIASFTTVLSYCDATSGSVEPITRVVFAGIDNTSSADSSSDAYEDFTDTLAEVEAGETYSFAAEGNTSGSFTNYFTVWVDWNQNGELEDDEMYEIGSIQGSDGTDGQQAVEDIIVPEDALPGDAHMRVRKNFNSFYTDPCGSNSYGQTEDYTVNVAGDDGGDEVACSEENPNDGSFENGFNISSETDFKTANDLTVAADEDFTLTNITASIFGNDGITNVNVTYYDAAAGLPGSVIGSEDSVTIDSQSVIGENFDIDVNEVEMSVTPFDFNGRPGVETTYWIELSATDGGETPNVFWTVSSSSMNGNPSAQFDNGWVVNDTDMDGVYIWEGICSPMEVGEDCSGAPDAGIASVDPATGGPDSTYTVSAENFTTGNGLTYQWQSNTDDSEWEDEGILESYYAPFTATAPADIGVEVEWRLAVTCTFSNEVTFSEVDTFTTVIDYCDATSSIAEPITRVVFAGIDNESPVASNEGYEDFTDVIAEVEAGETYTFAAEGDTGGNYENFFTVWIDWNNNGQFEADEMYEIGSIENSDGTDGQQAVNEIVVPEDAALEEVRMRVRKNYSSPYTDPCGENTFGQVEDYTVNVGTLGMDDNTATDFTYYPNPMDEVLHIQANIDIKSIAVYNVLGQEILGNKHFTINKVDVSSLPTGTYIFRVTFNNGSIENFKAVKK